MSIFWSVILPFSFLNHLPGMPEEYQRQHALQTETLLFFCERHPRFTLTELYAWMTCKLEVPGEVWRARAGIELRRLGYKNHGNQFWTKKKET